MKLEEHPFIRSISEERRAGIADEVEILELNDGEVIFGEDSAPDALFLILSGNVAFTKEKLDGSLKNVSQSGEGSFFGEVGVFTGEHRALGAVALGRCRVARVPERMVNMANDLAAFARGDSQIEIAYVSIDTLFTYFRELNTPFFKDESVELVMQGNGTSLDGDASKLLRVLQNLISNSIEALHSADIDGKVEVIAEENDKAVTITLSDNGPGIPEDIRDTFFEPFVTRGKNEGTGLGTAIVKSIIDAHHGEIEFETSARGTTFTIRLPKKR